MSTLGALARAGLLSPGSLRAAAGALRETGPNLAALVAASARRQGDQAAIGDGETALSYAELHAAVAARAAALAAAHRLGPRSRVALLGRSTTGYVVHLLALARLGCHLHLLSPDASPAQLAATLAARHFDLLVQAEPGIGNPRGATQPIDGALPPGPPVGRRSGGALVVLTGGTSGRPKEAARRPAPLPFVRAFAALIDRLGLAKCRGVLIATPLHHGMGLAGLLVALALGQEVVLLPRFDAAGAAAAIDKRGLEAALVVPTMLQRLLAAAPVGLASLRAVICGAASLDPVLAAAARERLGPVVHNLYGTSETGACIHAAPADLADRPGTIGRPLPGIRLAVQDEAGRARPAGAPGRLLVKSPLAVSRGFVETGDLARIDADGFVYLRGRQDDMIVSGGENVYPADVEAVLAGHPAVAAVAVVGMPDAALGQRLKAFVVLHPDAAVTADDLAEWLRPRLARYQRPAMIALRAELPQTPIGKVDRARLRRAAADG